MSACRQCQNEDPFGPAPIPGLRRWLRFNCVGAGGLALQLGLIALLQGPCHWHYLPATAAGVEAALLHNFVWHQVWTWKDRPLQKLLAGLVQFHFLTGGISLFGNLVGMALLVGWGRLPVLPANLAVVAFCALFNYLAADRWVFPQWAPSHSSRASVTRSK